jgi:branched-subunit amino acid transport protein
VTAYASWQVWLAIGLAGVGTQLIRLSFMATLRRATRIPDVVMRGLRLIPAAVLAALALPALVRPEGAFDVTWDNHRLIAGLIAALVAWLTRNVIATIAAGMGVLWLLTWLA